MPRALEQSSCIISEQLTIQIKPVLSVPEFKVFGCSVLFFSGRAFVIGGNTSY